MNPSALKIQWLTYSLDPAVFVRECVYIYDATGQDWVRFELWPAQVETLGAMAASRKLVILKARQLGISWLVAELCAVADALPIPRHHPALFVCVKRNPRNCCGGCAGCTSGCRRYLRARAVTHSNETRWILSNGSRALAFSTQSGRSYTGTLALVDEADFVPELCQFLNAVKPTIDAGGQLFLVSTSDKKRPISTFKNLFRAAAAKADGGTVGGDYRHIFLPWWTRPGRDEAWRQSIQAEMYAQRGTDDDFYAEYPASAEEALAAEQLDRRLPWAWVKGCVDAACTDTSCGDTSWRYPHLLEVPPPPGGTPTSWKYPHLLEVPPPPGGVPSLPGLTVWEEPMPGRRYVMGADPAEGNPNSDESAACVLDAESWGQVAELTGKIEPSTFAGYLDELGRWYNGAEVMAERNNHGHLLIRELQRLGNLRVLAGYDGRPGWLSNVKGKPLLYGLVADAVRDGACSDPGERDGGAAGVHRGVDAAGAGGAAR